MADAYATFGTFLLLKRRTQDGLGTLWRAGEMEGTGFKRMVWLRRFDQGGMDRAALRAEMAAANQLGQSLRASNVVRNASGGTEGGVPYIAWDYVPAQPLDQLLARTAEEQFPIAIDNALLIVEKLAAALAAAAALEAQGEPLIHGFLVPNLVVVGNDGEAQVAGFGVSRGLRANLDRPAVKKLAAPYLAPEVLTNGCPTGRSDVYSLGAILYHLLTATPLPAEPDERAAALEKPQLALDEGPVPQDVLAILRKTLAVRPEDRYTSAGEFKRELERLLYGGAYSPTTFNLALFMDRLYRNEMEQEDRELERERSLDVAPYYHPPRAEVAEAPAPAAEAPTPNRTFLYAIAGGAVVLLSVIGYLLVSRPSSAPVDAEAQKRMFQELANTLVTQALKEKEEQLRKELEAEKARTEELRQQLDKQKQGAAGSRRVGSDEQQRLQNELAAREAEQKKKEDELARVRQQQEAEAARAREQQAQLASNPAAAQVVAVAAIAPTPMPPAPLVPLAVAAAGPAPAAAAPATPTAAAPVDQAPSTTGSGVVEGDLVDLTEVDVPPQTLVETKVTLPRVAARTPLSGYVILRVLVNEKGGVDDVAVLRGFSPPTSGVDEACVRAVKQRRYKPAMKGGQRVKTWLTVKLIFTPAAR